MSRAVFTGTPRVCSKVFQTSLSQAVFLKSNAGAPISHISLILEVTLPQNPKCSLAPGQAFQMLPFQDPVHKAGRVTAGRLRSWECSPTGSDHHEKPGREHGREGGMEAENQV